MTDYRNESADSAFLVFTFSVDRKTSYDLLFSHERGIFWREWAANRDDPVPMFELSRSGVSNDKKQGMIFKIIDMVEDCDVYPFKALHVWCSIACVAQMIVLLLLTFEPPGFKNYDSNTLRYISDNIDVHRGYGSCMVLAFAMSFIPLLLCVVENYLLDSIMFFMVGVAAAGGGLVVMCHSTGASDALVWMHISGAGAFIFGGIVLHGIVSLDIRRYNLHGYRDLFLFGIIILVSVTFLGSIIYIKRTRIERSDPDHWQWFWVSGGCEYILYMSMIGMNLLVSERVRDNLCRRISDSVYDTVTSRGSGRKWLLGYYTPVPAQDEK